MSSYILSFFNRLLVAIDFLINYVLLHHRSMLHLPENEEAECAICLSKIEDDDEIWELRCDHLFHKNCLDTWISCKHTTSTCPLCRDNLVVPPKIDGVCEMGNQDVLFYDFCGTDSSEDEGRWWVR
ncbi:hypothetical protein LXL04_011175 [Taraxacum kok-saghyz]